MSLKSNLTRAFGLAPRGPSPAAALYASALTRARDPAWFSAGGVPDTLDGRFDMLALVLALTIGRLQVLGLFQCEADLTDRFTEDMDASLREIGVSDLAIAKQVGNTVGALGGRIGAYRAGFADDALLADALTRNLYRGVVPEPSVLAWAVREARVMSERIDARDAASLTEGRL